MSRLQNKTRKDKRVLRDNISLLLLAAPGIVYYIMFHYVPMFGLILAFKNYRYDEGIFGSAWWGFKNFEFFFRSQYAWRVTRNTVGYGILFTVATLTAAVVVALLMVQVKKRRSLKAYQTCMFLPNFISWVLVSEIVFIIISPSQGIINQFLKGIGLEPIEFFSNPNYWPYLLVIINIWKNVGMQTLIYYASLLSIDTELYEAAEIDGAGRLQQTLNISLPHLIPSITIMSIMSIGNFFRGDFGLFYNVPRNTGALYASTDIIDTFVYRGLMQLGDIGMSSAVGLFQSIAGLILVVISNQFVRKINPDNSLF